MASGLSASHTGVTSVTFSRVSGIQNRNGGKWQEELKKERRKRPAQQKAWSGNCGKH